MRKYWYVKARNVETGEEIRMAAADNGVAGPAGAEIEMKAYLVRTGRAKPDVANWEIVEVCRLGEVPESA